MLYPKSSFPFKHAQQGTETRGMRLEQTHEGEKSKLLVFSPNIALGRQIPKLDSREILLTNRK